MHSFYISLFQICTKHHILITTRSKLKFHLEISAGNFLQQCLSCKNNSHTRFTTFGVYHGHIKP